MKPRLIFSLENDKDVGDLSRSFAGCADLTALSLKPNQLSRLEGLDALYLSLPYAERWGSYPILYKAQILKTRPEDIGMPPYVISGVAMPVEEMRDPRFELQLVIAAVLEAVEVFNLENASPIIQIGLSLNMLGVDKLSALEAGSIIRATYENKYAP